MHTTMTTSTNAQSLAGPSFSTALYGFLSTTVVTTGLLFLLSSL